MSSIMTNITTDIANAVDKVVNDVTTAAEAGFNRNILMLRRCLKSSEWCAS